jgi:SAM-dependent methyltransferase
VPELPREATTPGHGAFEEVADYYDHLMRTVPYGQWVDYVERLLGRWRATPRRVLDLACGTGKVGAEMLRRGYEVVGADLSEPMARGCRGQEPPLSAVVSDARQLALRSGQFDLVVCLYDSLNYILEPEGLAAAVSEAGRVLRGGGLLIFDLNTVRALSAALFSQSSLYGRDPLKYDWHSHWDPESRICRVDMWFGYTAEDGSQHQFEETHYQRAYSYQEVTGMLRAAGFGRWRAYTAYQLTPLTPWSDRAYYVARKEKSA